MSGKLRFPRARVLWTTTVTWNAAFHRAHDGATLAVAMMPDNESGDRFVLLAVETDAGNNKIAQVLDSHAHKLIGEDLTFDEARKQGEEFGRAWRKQPGTGELCPCDEIEPLYEIEPRHALDCDLDEDCSCGATAYFEEQLP